MDTGDRVTETQTEWRDDAFREAQGFHMTRVQRAWWEGTGDKNRKVSKDLVDIISMASDLNFRNPTLLAT